MSSVSSATSSNAAYYASQKSFFNSLDTDKDGSLSEAEFSAAKPKNTGAMPRLADLLGSDTSGDSGDEGSSSAGNGSTRPQSLDGLLSGDAMAILMAMSQQGGMSFGGGNLPMGSVADLYADIDTDGNGTVTKSEFVAGRPDDMSEEDASNLFAKIDTENTGSITEEQFSDSMPEPLGPPPSGGAPQGGGASTDETYDALDTNKDGVVSMEEFVAARPDDVSDEEATSLFKSLDTEGTGSLSRDQLADFLQPDDAEDAGAGQMGGGMPGIDELLSLIESMNNDADTGAEAS